METVYTNQGEMFYVVYDQLNNQYILKVVVGGSAMYEVEKKMTQEMVEAFNNGPEKLMPYVKEIRSQN